MTAASSTDVPDRDEYILGTDPDELERLRFQHQVWLRQAYDLFARGGLRAGDHVLDLGCGPGFTSIELAHHIGAEGRVIACDQSARFLATLRRECAHLGLRQIEPRLGRVEDLTLEPGELDAAYARWLFCWLPEPGAVLARIAASLRRGGRILLQEYLDWGAMRLVPHGPAFARAVEACLASWRAGGATIDFAAHVPDLAARCDLAITHFEPRARLGAVGSLEWRWIGEFFRLYLPKVVERGLLQAHERDAWQREWDERQALGRGYVATPTVADVVLQK